LLAILANLTLVAVASLIERGNLLDALVNKHFHGGDAKVADGFCDGPALHRNSMVFGGTLGLGLIARH
jgi:hypothetical protein